MYADDTAICVSTQNKAEVSSLLQEDLSRVNNWLCANRLNLHHAHVEKTSCMHGQFFNFLVYRFFCPDLTVRGRNENKVRSCVLLLFFHQKNRVGSLSTMTLSRPIRSPHS